ncbi:MAG TPA: EI24 domain-containing protein [Polyangiaceae bacterium]|nr:EI24 domain-containing protein [Polyangiaceae bacterium]
MMLVFSAFSWLLKNPRVWPVAAVPALIWCALSLLALTSGVLWLEPWLAARVPSSVPALTTGAAWTLTLLGSVLASWLALLLTPALSGPALERIVAAVERDIGAPERASMSWFAEVGCGLRAMLVGFALVTPLILASLLLDAFAPVLAPLSVALKLLATSLGLSWGLLDYPLTLRGMRVRQRLSLVHGHWRSVLGFGLGLLPFFWFPCCQLVSLPVAVAAATMLSAELSAGVGAGA